MCFASFRSVRRAPTALKPKLRLEFLGLQWHRRLTSVDANVLIAAFRGTEEIHQRAMQVLGDPDREFVVNPYLEMEVLPKPTYHQYEEEREFMEEFLSKATVKVPSSPDLSSSALALAKQHGLSAIDALHAATAISANVDEFVTAEMASKPFFRMQGNLQITSIANTRAPKRGWQRTKAVLRRFFNKILS